MVTTTMAVCVFPSPKVALVDGHAKTDEILVRYVGRRLESPIVLGKYNYVTVL